MARRYRATLAAAYPAGTVDVVDALTGTAPWPGRGSFGCASSAERQSCCQDLRGACLSGVKPLERQAGVALTLLAAAVAGQLQADDP
jgi:hypothetical protein